MKRALVVQLYRIGDVLQTFAVFRGLRAAHPGALLDLLVDPVCADAGALCPDIDRVLLFPRPGLRAILQRQGDAGQALYLAAAAVERLRLEGYDLVVNLHQDVLGKRLAGAVGAAATLGPVIPPQGPQRLLGAGAEAFVRGVADRRTHRRNVVDHFLEIAGLPGGSRGRVALPPASRLRSRELITSRLGDQGPLVVVQASASRPFRGLDSAWIEALQHLVPQARYAWTGSASERDGIRKGLESGLKGACFAGETGIDDTAAMIAEADLLVSGDTAALHLAALVGTPSVSVFFGTAQPWETGPYGSGHVCLFDPPECAPCRFMDGCGQPVCKSGLDAGTFAQACLALLEGSQVPGGLWISELSRDGLSWSRTPPCAGDAPISLTGTHGNAP